MDGEDLWGIDPQAIDQNGVGMTVALVGRRRLWFWGPVSWTWVALNGVEVLARGARSFATLAEARDALYKARICLSTTFWVVNPPRYSKRRKTEATS